MVGPVEVHASARHLACRAHERDRPSAGEVQGLEQRRCRPGQRRRRRKVPQAGVGRMRLGPAPSQRSHQPPLDRGRALVLDQLLADRPGQRLERLRTASSPAAMAAGAASARSADREESACERRPDPRPRPTQSACVRCRVPRPRGCRPLRRTGPVAAAPAPPAQPLAARRGGAAVRAQPRDGAARRPCPLAASAGSVPPGEPPRTPRQPSRPLAAPALRRARPRRAQSRPPSRCTSTSSERLPTIWTSSPALDAPRLRAETRLGERPLRRARSGPGSAALTAAHQADDRGPGDESPRGRPRRPAPPGWRRSSSASRSRARRAVDRHARPSPPPRAPAARRFPRYRRVRLGDAVCAEAGSSPGSPVWEVPDSKGSLTRRSVDAAPRPLAGALAAAARRLYSARSYTR